MSRMTRHQIRDRTPERAEVSLTNYDGEPIKDYSIIFYEFFCVATADLAHNSTSHWKMLMCYPTRSLAQDKRSNPKSISKDTK
jgi:hypothetical protein